MKKGQPPDRLATRLRDVSPDDLRRALVKDTPITFRATKQERDDMHRVASDCGLTLTDYLIRLHRLASQRLSATSSDAG
jgi:hypothetical protein